LGLALGNRWSGLILNYSSVTRFPASTGKLRTIKHASIGKGLALLINLAVGAIYLIPGASPVSPKRS